MQKIEAFKCEKTGQLFERQQDACRSEFRCLMKAVAGHLPGPGSRDLSPTEYMDWLADQMAGGVYPSAFPALRDAVYYYEEFRSAIERR